MCGIKCCPYKNDVRMQCEWCPNREPDEFDFGDYDEFEEIDDFEDFNKL